MSPRTAEQNEAVRAESRARIIKAALKLFGQHGYEGTSVRMIADASGMAQGLLYNYFQSKEHLLQAIFRESMEQVQHTFSVADQVTQPAQRVEALLRAAAHVVRDNLDFWRLSYSVRMQPGVVAGLGPALQQWTHNIRRTLEGYLQDAGVPNPDVEARVLFAAIDGICQHYVLEPRRYPMDDVLDAVVARYARPVRRKP